MQFVLWLFVLHPLHGNLGVKHQDDSSSQKDHHKYSRARCIPCSALFLLSHSVSLLVPSLLLVFPEKKVKFQRSVNGECPLSSSMLIMLGLSTCSSPPCSWESLTGVGTRVMSNPFGKASDLHILLIGTAGTKGQLKPKSTENLIPICSERFSMELLLQQVSKLHQSKEP